MQPVSNVLYEQCADIIPCCHKRISGKYSQISLKHLCKCYGQQEHHCWVKGKITYKTGKAELHDFLCSGHTVRAVSSEMLLYTDAIVHWDKCITICQLALNISTSTGSISHIIHDLGYSNIYMCAGDTSLRNFMGEHKTIFL